MNPLFWLCNTGFKTTTRLFGDRKVEGWENVPRDGPVIFVANHLSNLDPAIVAALTGRNPSFLAKEELFKFPLFSVLLRMYGAHPLKRGSSDIKAMRWALKRLNGPNSALILFPEGTRSRNAQGLKKGLPGVTHIAQRTGTPIVPIGITGTERLQNVLRVLFPRATIRIRIGEPFRLTDSLSNRPSRNEVEAANTEIMVRIAHLLPEALHGVYREKTDARFVYTKTVDSAPSRAVSAPAT